MARKITELKQGQILYLNETVNGNTSFVPYIYLGLDECNIPLILHKYGVFARGMNNINLAEYIDCDMDLFLTNREGDLWKTVEKKETVHVDYRETGYLSRFDEATRNCLVRTQLKHYVLSEQAIVTIDRECFLLSYSQLGYATTPDEGKSFLDALKISYDTTDANRARICRNTSESAVNCWMSSEYSAGAFRYSSTGGGAYYDSAANSGNYFRPALAVSPDTLVSDETEETIYLLPDSANPYRELDVIINMGEREKIPKSIVCMFDCQNSNEIETYATVNLHDESPVWFKVENGIQTDTSFMTAEMGCCLGVKVYAKSNGRAILKEPIIICN